ncbi:hypothetical protein GCM10009630_19010 [Kribbella jejuensis]|uniref:Uncharacterized protein n=1 Tax=Kribbella jejuensis TaxID=236068 RepID=A0A542ELB2_9ACTN|nr:hypothetical protein [Kribbella jejuensis]TQJ16132.1 hypothetical protein FB475_0221 [Kribbella jejuensis]
MADVPWVPVGMFVTAMVLAVVTRLRPHKPKPEIALLAQRLGLRYTARDYEIGELVAGLHPRGRFRRANDVVHGDFFGYPVTAFTYTSHEEGRDSERAHRNGYHHGYIWITLPVELPRLDIDRGIPDVAGFALGWTPVRTESGEFNQRFNPRAADDRFAHAVLHPRMIEFLLARNPPDFRIVGNRVGFDRLGGGYSPAEIWWSVHFLREFVDLIPAFVRRDFAVQRPTVADRAWPASS